MDIIKFNIVKRKLFEVIIILAATILLSELVFRLHLSIERNKEQQNLFLINSYVAQEIQRNLSEGISSLNAMEYILKLNNFSTESFDSWKTTLFDQYNKISAIQLAPNGVVRKIYPIENNEKAIGHDLLKDKRRKKGALRAINAKEITVIGPLTLIQNGRKAIIARKPVFKENEFWGFVIVLIDLKDKLLKEMSDIDQKNLYYQLEGNNPDDDDNPIIAQNTDSSSGWMSEFPIILPNSKWVLKLKYKHLVYAERHEHILILTVFLFTAVLFSLLRIRMLNKAEKLKELEERNTILAAGITANHEIKQPLSVIQMYVDMIYAICQKHNVTEFQRFYPKVIDSIERITKILDRFNNIDSYHIDDYVKGIKMVVFDDKKDNENEKND